MPTYTPINRYAATIVCLSPPCTIVILVKINNNYHAVNIPPEYQDIKICIVENTDRNVGDETKLINDVGISAAVKVRSCQP
jgi:hypothetical protein